MERKEESKVIMIANSNDLKELFKELVGEEVRYMHIEVLKQYVGYPRPINSFRKVVSTWTNPAYFNPPLPIIKNIGTTLYDKKDVDAFLQRNKIERNADYRGFKASEIGKI